MNFNASNTHYSLSCVCRPHVVPLSGYLDDLHVFDPATTVWTLLSAAEDINRPAARGNHGFASAGGKFYVFGGCTWSGKCEPKHILLADHLHPIDDWFLIGLS
jgi:hypothetical protein